MKTDVVPSTNDLILCVEIILVQWVHSLLLHSILYDCKVIYVYVKFLVCRPNDVSHMLIDVKEQTYPTNEEYVSVKKNEGAYVYYLYTYVLNWKCL